MLEIFNEENYNFTDSIINEIKLDQNTFDFLIVVDYFLGKNKSRLITLRLKNVKSFCFYMNDTETKNDLFTPYTLANIAKKKKGKLVELIVESSLAFFSEHQNDKPLIYCLCDEIYIEK